MNNLEPATKYGDNVLALLEKAGVSGIPVDVVRVADCLGLTIIEQPLEDEYSGFLAVKEKVVVVNNAHPPTRRRFTIAHEIGHYQLHRRKKADTPVFIDRTVFCRGAPSSADAVAERALEREANHYAAELLMPAAWLAEYLDKHPLHSSLYSREVKEIAGEFDVSKQAMDFRLRDLGFVLPTSI